MTHGIIVRPASAADVPAMSAVMTASITELCTADHAGDPDVVAGWTRNKTPEGVERMLVSPELSIFVAEIGGAVGAVGALAGADTVALNYVSPAHRFRGFSRALLARMETEMASRGVVIGRLVSTATALSFYRACGWKDAGPAEHVFGIPGYPMTKRLPADGRQR